MVYDPILVSPDCLELVAQRPKDFLDSIRYMLDTPATWTTKPLQPLNFIFVGNSGVGKVCLQTKHQIETSRTLLDEY